MDTDTARLEIKLPRERLAELEAYARQAGLTVSAAARLAIAQMIADIKREARARAA
jgi:post-segregation antitoxin (ccd killing protein)